MKKWVKILLGIILALLLIAAAVAWWQWENLRAVYIMLTTDEASIVQSLEDKRLEQDAWLSEEYSVAVTAPSAAQSNALLSGEVSPDEVKASLGITGEVENEIRDTEQTASKTKETKKSDKKTLTKAEIEKYVNLCVAELYACEVDLMARLGEMKKGIEAEWAMTSPKTQATKRETIMRWLNKVYDLEVEIDGKVKAIIAKYNGILKSYGADTSGVDKLWDYYLSKKADQKAYYMNLYL
ncbi:MAG: hypothetical protein IJP38_05145 [Oscillospiraceae bacterium]|nr:hypothetical protein [Oscillospiraceae bacterium]MBQ9985673.1 hypothetical protein [Oscillospiraceae bacterium]